MNNECRVSFINYFGENEEFYKLSCSGKVNLVRNKLNTIGYIVDETNNLLMVQVESLEDEDNDEIVIVN